MEFGIGEFLSLDGTADAHTAKSKGLDRMPNLFDREIGVLQGDGGKGHETIGRGGANLGKCGVLYFDQLSSGIPLGVVPIRIDAERRDVFKDDRPPGRLLQRPARSS